MEVDLEVVEVDVVQRLITTSVVHGREVILVVDVVAEGEVLVTTSDLTLEVQMHGLESW
jgi:hypoxanthine-guanine phosphoribosyltransferase